MELNVLSLNCQKNYNKNLQPFLEKVLRERKYGLFLLQEATKEVWEHFQPFADYKVLDYETVKNGKKRLALSCIVYDSRSLRLEDSFYEPIFSEIHEKNEIKKFLQSFGVVRALFDMGGIKILAGSMHLPSGFLVKKRFECLTLVKEIIKEVEEANITLFGGDCNFCFPAERKNAEKIMQPEYRCTTFNLGSTLDSYYTEEHLRSYYWIRINNILRKFGLNAKFKTDHLFVDKETSFYTKTRILQDRISDHSPLEIRLYKPKLI